MMAPFAEDLTPFFDPAGLGVAASYTPAGGAAKTINGVFEDEYVEINSGDVGVEGSGPKFICAAADVSGVKQGDALVINSVSYTVSEVQPDGAGVVELVLRKV